MTPSRLANGVIYINRDIWWVPVDAVFPSWYWHCGMWN